MWRVIARLPGWARVLIVGIVCVAPVVLVALTRDDADAPREPAARQSGPSATSTASLPAELTELRIRPARPSLAPGERQHLAVYGIFTDGSRIDLTAKASWGSSDTHVATVRRGLVTALRAGTTTISASYEVDIGDSIVVAVR